jgi:uncharacterized protein YcnI
MKKTRITAGASIALALGTALALSGPLAASAHVTLDDNTAEAGSYALLTFKVPNESDTASTTSLTIDLPTDTPFVSVRTVPLPGWTAEVVTTTLPEPVQIGETTVTEAPTSIVWTATGAGLGGTELGLFTFSAGPVPDVGQIALPAHQGYSDSSVVDWTGDEVPILYVNDAPAADHHGGAAEEEPAAGDDHADDAGHDDATEAGTDPTAVAALATGIGGLVLGAAALVLTLLRRRSAA